MSEFSGIEAFVHTAELRSFKAASERLGVSAAAISKAIARLEERLGVRLLDRTSRRVSATEAGQIWLEHARAALDELQAGRDKLSSSMEVPRGLLKVSMPFIFADAVVPYLAPMTWAHPRLVLDVRFEDRKVSLVEEEVDVVVRVGELEPSALIARRLKRPRWVTVASPAYLARRPVLEVPFDLEDPSHTFLKFSTPSGSLAEPSFRGRGGEVLAVKVPTTHRFNHGAHLVAASAAGMGVTQAFDFLVEEAIQEGALLEVLGSYAPEGPVVHALWRFGQGESPKTRLFIEMLVKALGVD